MNEEPTADPGQKPQADNFAEAAQIRRQLNGERASRPRTAKQRKRQRDLEIRQEWELRRRKLERRPSLVGPTYRRSGAAWNTPWSVLRELAFFVRHRRLPPTKSEVLATLDYPADVWTQEAE